MSKILIIGLDGFVWSLGERLIKDGFMPALKKLRENGSYGTLRSVFPFETSPAWSSFQTGCLPEKTGIYSFHTFNKQSRELKLNSLADNRMPDIWQLLTDAGKKVICVNMPVSYPYPKVDGAFIPGLLCPGISSETVYPSEIFNKYIKGSGYKIVDNRHIDNIDKFVDNAINTEDIRCSITANIMEDIEWDVCCLQMQSSDLLQHRLWGALESGALGYKDQDYAVAARFYNAVDIMIGDLVKKAADDTVVLVVSDHGFCGLNGSVGLNRWLLEKGYLVLKENLDKQSFSIKESIKDRVYPVKAAARVYGKLKKRFFSDNLNHSEKDLEHLRRLIDLEKSKAFCLGGLGGLIYLNCSDDKEVLAAEIKSLLEKEEIENNCPFKKVSAGEDVYPAGVNAPDIVVEFDEGWQCSLNPYSEFVSYDNLRNGRQMGTHSPNGIFVVSGKGSAVSKFGCDIVDIAPTVLAAAGVSIPSYIDGRVINEAFMQSFDVVTTDDDKINREKIDYSDQEQAEVEKQLNDLGYM